MNENDRTEEAAEVLRQLGLKEYEAMCFVGLTRLSDGTAKQLSEITDVPRTRVYDAIRVLESQGLVEIQHSSPQRFRAVPLEEATETLRNQYDDRIERLKDALETAPEIEPDDERPIQEVWSMTGSDAISNRTRQLVGEAEEEVVLVVGDDTLFTPELVDELDALDPEVDLLVGAATELLQEQIHDAVPRARTFVSELGWLGDESMDEVAIVRLLLVDRSTILVSTLVRETGEEHAVFGRGFRNGLVVIARRLMAQGLLPTRDPGSK